MLFEVALKWLYVYINISPFAEQALSPLNEK